ncbi:GGDEF domain-containing protein [Niveibacterium sp. SC-1]|uniref:GGDEF domain-containing protein n=1 Tax=Niveibacterium sp. SC-1 TaxID=3135646 RepID=UPI00311E0F71
MAYLSAAQRRIRWGDMDSPSESRIAQQQAIRMRRFRLAPLTYLLTMLVAIAAAAAAPEPERISPLRWVCLVLTALGINLVFWWLLRSGRNLRFKDPSLTAPQIVASGYWGLIILSALPSQRAVMVMYYFSAFAFGILQLNVRQYLGVAAMLMAGYAAMLGEEVIHGRPGLNLPRELLTMLIFGVLLVWFSLFGGFVSRLRRELKSRKAALELANARIHRQATTDELTDIANRRHALDALRRMKALADRFGLPLSVALIDIDHFKSVNDRFGHGTGDLALQEFAASLRDGLREADEVLPPIRSQEEGTSMVARYGGEEFVILLPGADLEAACLCVERLRSACKVRAGTDALTFSSGLASYRAGESIEQLLARADRGLYGAKEGGRNRVCVVEE